MYLTLLNKEWVGQHISAKRLFLMNLLGKDWPSQF